MKYAFTRNNMVADVVAVVAICGTLFVLADNPSQQPVQPNQKGKADMGSSTTISASGPRFDPASEFRRAFKAAATATERRDLVMKACDDRLISSRMNLDNLKNLFGDWPMLIVYPADKATGKQSAILYFTPPKPAPTEHVTAAPDQTPHHDWYMWFFFENPNTLRSYYLTNYGK